MLDPNTNVREGYKLSFDAFKQLVTLDSALIVLMVTFLRESERNTASPELVGWAFGLLALSLVTGVLVLMGLARYVTSTGAARGWGRVANFSAFVSTASFVGAILVMALYGYLNF